MNYPSKKILAIIGARSGSKGIKDKNIIDLAGKPLLAYSIEAGMAIVDHVVVSTDSQEYARIAKKHGADEVIMRPPELAQDDTPDYPWIRHLLEETKYHGPELLVLLRPTTPLRDPKVLSRAIKVFFLANEPTSMRSVHQMSESAWKTCEIDKGCLHPLGFCFGASMDKISRPRLQYSPTYQPNGYIDIIRVEQVVRSPCLYGHKVIPFLTPRVTEVDTPEDLEYLSYEMGKR